MFKSLPPYGPTLARHLCPWDSLGKNTRVGCHFLLQGVFLTQGSDSRQAGSSTTSATWAALELANDTAIPHWGMHPEKILIQRDIHFLVGPVVKNLPANAWDMGCIPDLGRSHMLQNYQARVPRLLSLNSSDPLLCSRRTHLNEKLMQHS